MAQELLEALQDCEKRVNEYFHKPRFRERFKPDDLREAVFAYIDRPGKRLRPALLLWSCGAVGGDENVALPAAAGVELFHTWTLVHDDLIDNDDTRRGGPSVHKMGEAFAAESLGYDGIKARDYGRDLAVLTGDAQHGWTVSLFCECIRFSELNPEVVVDIIYDLESRVIHELLEGETLDVQYEAASIDDLSDKDILHMLKMKTAALCEFAARAGAMLGLNISDQQHPSVAALSRFAGLAGLAFQLQDDVLGVTAQEEKLGKPVGSDIREGKKTLVAYHALQSASPEDRAFLLSVLGDPEAGSENIQKAVDIMVASGAVEKTNRLAQNYIQTALSELDTIPDSDYKGLLAQWAHFMIDRKF